MQLNIESYIKKVTEGYEQGTQCKPDSRRIQI